MLQALLLGVALLLPAGAAAQMDVIRGRVTGVDGQALVGTRVTATSLSGNVTRSTQTNDKGSYQIAFPGAPGDYVMGFAHFGYAFKQFELKRLADEAVLVADARLSPIQLDSLLVVAQGRERVDRSATNPDVGGSERPVDASSLPPELQGNLAAMAASLPGVTLVPGLDGQADGFSVLGLGADQNSTTLNGLQTGANGLPRDASVASSLNTSPYDVSRGGFSGANFNISSRSGSNMRMRGMSLVGTAPQLQWVDPAGRSLGNAYTNLSLGGMASGALKQNASFYNVSWQLGRQSRDNATLLNTDPLGLRTAGVASDSVARLLGILSARGVPTLAGRHANRLSDDGSVYGRIDFSPPRSSSGHSIGLTFNGSWRRQTAVSSGATSLESTSGDHAGWSGGLQAQHSGYLGMVLSETSAGINASRDYDSPYLDLPSGRVLVNSSFPDGGSGVQNLAFGGASGLRSDSRTLGASLQNSLSWFDGGNKHRLRLSGELRYSGNTQTQATNRFGSFGFNSLADVAAGRPSYFSRTLSARERSTGQVAGALSLGDAWRRTNDLQFQYGVRVDASRYTTTPTLNPLLQATFGVRNDRAPAPIAFSPRAGFTWTVGRAPEISSFAGAARAPRAVIQGGVSVQAGVPGASQIGSALDNTGLPDAVRQISCVGAAVPIPDWAAYAADPASIPERCADGSSGTVFSSSAPGVTLFAPGFGAPKSVRANLQWRGNVLDGRFAATVDGTWSYNLGQQRFVDLNFRAQPRFTLSDDGRSVFVDPASIVPGTGAVAAQDGRISPAFSRVMEYRSDLRSRSGQASLRLFPVPRGPTRFSWSGGYTWSATREQVAGFSSTAGDPLGIEWSRSSQGPHQLSYSLGYKFFDAVSVSWNGSFRSGTRFTPGVGGDLNGDGYSNDRAFLFDPANTADATLAQGMRTLLATAPGGIRGCLERQLGRIAGRNSCTGPWTSNASLAVSLDRARFRMPSRGSISFSLSNPLGAADMLLHGNDGLHGWGQPAFADPTLYYVRGFDPGSRRFRYELNSRFGSSRPQFATFRAPVVLTASVRIDLGPTRERQLLEQQLASRTARGGGATPELFLRMQLASGGLANPLATILRSQDSLRLTSLQADSIAAMNRRYTYRADSLWAPVLRHIASLPKDADGGEVNGRYVGARRAQVSMLEAMGPAVRGLLTAEQRRKLPTFVASMLDPRYLALIRDGTYTYVDSGAGMIGGMGMMAGVPFVSMSGAGNVIMIMRSQ